MRVSCYDYVVSTVDCVRAQPLKSDRSIQRPIADCMVEYVWAVPNQKTFCCKDIVYEFAYRWFQGT